MNIIIGEVIVYDLMFMVKEFKGDPVLPTQMSGPLLGNPP